jgi:hypothetical protein
MRHFALSLDNHRTDNMYCKTRPPNRRLRLTLALFILALLTPTEAYNSFTKARALPLPGNIHFSQSGELYLKTGEALVNFELPIAPTACLAINFNKALWAKHPKGDDFGEAVRSPVNGKCKTLQDSIDEIKRYLKIMGFWTHIEPLCYLPQYQVVLNVDPAARIASRPTPPKPTKITRAPNCMALRTGHTCAHMRNKRDNTANNLLNGILDIYATPAIDKIANKLGKTAAKTIQKALNKHAMKTEKDNVYLDGWQVLMDIPAKILRGTAGFGVGKVLEVASDFATALTLFKTSARLNKLSAHVEELDTRMGEMTKVIADVLNHLEQEWIGHNYGSICRQIETFSDDLNLITTAILQKYFPPIMFRMKAFEAAIKELQKEAREKGDELLHTSPMGALQSSMGYTYESTGNLNIFLKLDLTRESLRMKLHEVFLVPFQTSNGLLVIQTDIKYIAVTETPSGSFITMTAEEYKSCHYVAGKLLCPNARVVNKKDLAMPGFNSAMCIFSALNTDNNGIKKFCTFTRPLELESLQSISDNEFIGFSTRPLVIAILCETEEATKFVETEPGTFILEMPDGCKADSPGHTVWNNYELSAQSIYLRRRVTIPHALRTLSNQTSEDIKFLVDTHKTLLDLQERNDVAQRSIFRQQLAYNNPFVFGLSITIAVFLTAAILYCSCKHRKAIAKTWERFRKSRDAKKQFGATHGNTNSHPNNINDDNTYSSVEMDHIPSAAPRNVRNNTP